MKTSPTKALQILYLLVRTGLGAVFLWASWDKILYPDKFATIIANYNILPDVAINLAALILPWVEMTCGLLLLVGRMVPGAALIINTLLLIFILATGYNLYRGLDVTCGCFSVVPDTGGHTRLNLIRNSFLLIAGIWLFFQAAGSRQTDQRKYPPLAAR